MNPASAAGWLGISAGIVFSLSILWTKGLKPVARAITIIADLPEWMAEQERRTVQLTPNHGTHLYDDVKQTKGEVVMIRVEQDRVKRELLEVKAHLSAGLAAVNRKSDNQHRQNKARLKAIEEQIDANTGSIIDNQTRRDPTTRGRSDDPGNH